MGFVDIGVDFTSSSCAILLSVMEGPIAWLHLAVWVRVCACVFSWGGAEKNREVFMRYILRPRGQTLIVVPCSYEKGLCDAPRREVVLDTM